MIVYYVYIYSELNYKEERMETKGLTIKKAITIILVTALMFSVAPIISDSQYVEASSKIKVSFNANGGKVAKKSKTVKYKKKYGKLPAPTKSGYKFVGWYTKKSGGKKVTAKTKVKTSSKHKLYAHWKKKVVVTFKDSYYGNEIKKKTYTYGGKYGKLPSVSTYSGKTIKGWIAFNGDSVGYNVTSKIKVKTKKNHTVYPLYSYSKGLHSQEAQKIFELVNIERAKNGLEPLKWSTRLTNSTNIRAVELNKYFSHYRPNGTLFDSLDEEVLHGENIAAGQNDAYDVMNEWMNSPGHRANILHPELKSIGISMYSSKKNWDKYYVQCFSYEYVD